jgi:UDP-glucuronate decarboxylase
VVRIFNTYGPQMHPNDGRALRLAGSKSKLVFKPLPADDPRHRKPDIELARKYLGWEPKVTLEDGLKETIEYFRRKLA